MNVFDATIPVFTKFLTNIERWIDKAVGHADARKFEAENFMTARLAVDQYDFIGQIQSACDQAKYTAAKLSGKAPPSHPDEEKTLAEVRARLKTVIEYLGTFKPEDFTGAEDRDVTYTWMQGKSLRGVDYLNHMALPNFYFHVTTAYAILRKHGVELGKQDFLGGLPFKA